jgi:hypothetical protein
MAEVVRKAVGEEPGKRKRRPRGHPKGLRFHVQQPEQITAICTRLKLEGPLLTFRDVADALSKRAGRRIGLGTIHRFANGVYPQDNSLRAVLGLPITCVDRTAVLALVASVKRDLNTLEQMVKLQDVSEPQLENGETKGLIK